MIDEKIAIGVIRTSFGLKGELKVKSFSGEGKHFLSLKEVFLKTRDKGWLHFRLEKAREQKGTILLKLAGIDTPETAKALRGSEIWVQRKYASPKHKDEYYHADLCACDVYLKDKKFGYIKSVIEGNVAELLEVITEENRVILVPFIHQYVGKVDISKHRIFLQDEASQL